MVELCVWAHTYELHTCPGTHMWVCVLSITPCLDTYSERHRRQGQRLYVLTMGQKKKKVLKRLAKGQQALFSFMGLHPPPPSQGATHASLHQLVGCWLLGMVSKMVCVAQLKIATNPVTGGVVPKDTVEKVSCCSTDAW